LFDKIIRPELGATKADKLTRAAVAKLHGKLSATPFQANHMLAAVGSMYAFGERVGLVPEGTNPARKITRFAEHRRERFLTGEELERLGAAIREAETTGIPWEVDEAAPKAKHIPKPQNRFTKIDRHAAAAIRLLLFTGARLREVLHLKWEHVDLERGLLFLPDSKTGRKTLVLNAPAMAVLAELPRVGAYVIAAESAGTDKEKPRADLKRPWAATAATAIRARSTWHREASAPPAMCLVSSSSWRPASKWSMCRIAAADPRRPI
jgi:integrase